jgi:hypothetical protein
MKRILTATVFLLLSSSLTVRADDTHAFYFGWDFWSNTMDSIPPEDAHALYAWNKARSIAMRNALSARGGCNADFLPFWVGWNCVFPGEGTSVFVRSTEGGSD